MGLRLADPDRLERLARSLDSKVRDIPHLMSRASNLGVSGELAGLAPIASWIADTAHDLRRRAKILRTPSKSPFDSLDAFGLPSSLAKNPAIGRNLDSSLKKILASHKYDTAKQRAQAIKDYFETLSPAQQAAVAEADPSEVGNLDGVPVNIRFAANRISIQEEYQKESEYLNGLAPNDRAYKRTQDRVNTLRGFLDPRIKKFKDPKKMGRITEVEMPRQFLLFDAHFGSTGDAKASPFPDGRVAEVVGDLESAKHVAFRVPGIGNRLDDFNSFSKGGYDLAQDDQEVESPDSAVVSWLGYDTPEMGDSVDPAKAIVGGQQLNAFRQGISVNIQPKATTSIIAHSYGTLVTSKALQDGLTNINNVTFMGSPGLGTNIHSVADFHMPGTNFYAMRAPGDFVSYSEGLGDDPADFSDITRLSTHGSHAHSEYYNRDTASLDNLQRVLTGDTETLTFTHTTLDEEMIGATEERKLVAFLEQRVPPSVAAKMGADLNPIIQGIGGKNSVEIGGSIAKGLGAMHGVLNKYNMLDRVDPDDLMRELQGLSGDIAFKAAFKEAKRHGASDASATAAGASAHLAAAATFSGVTFTAGKVLELDRLQNNVRQLGGDLATGGRDMFGTGSAMVGGLSNDGRQIVGDGSELAGRLAADAGRVSYNIGDTIANPSHGFSNATNVIRSVDAAKDSTIDKGRKIEDSLRSAKNTIRDNGGHMLNTAIDIGGSPSVRARTSQYLPLKL